MLLLIPAFLRCSWLRVIWTADARRSAASSSSSQSASCSGRRRAAVAASPPSVRSPCSAASRWRARMATCSAGSDTGARRARAAKADLSIKQRGDTNVLTTTEFRPPVSPAALATTPGVQRVTAYRGGFLDLDSRRVWVVAPPRSDPQPLLPVHFPGRRPGDGEPTAPRPRLGRAVEGRRPRAGRACRRSGDAADAAPDTLAGRRAAHEHGLEPARSCSTRLTSAARGAPPHHRAGGERRLRRHRRGRGGASRRTLGPSADLAIETPTSARRCFAPRAGRASTA